MYRSVVATNQKNLLTNKLESCVIEFTWDENGNRIEKTTFVKPYLYYEDLKNPNTTEKSMFGKPLSKEEFENEYEKREWIKQHPNVPLYDSLSLQRQYLLDKYCGIEKEDAFAQYPLRVFYIDIEIEIKDVFPDPKLADYPINVISLYDSLTSIMHVWVYKSKTKTDLNDVYDLVPEKRQNEINEEIFKYKSNIKIEYHLFDNEVKMLDDYINFWKNNYPDVITGWNIDRFDIKYIMSRVIKLFGDEKSKVFSPVNGRVKRPVFTILEKPQKGISNAEPTEIYRFSGISCCDYLNLYKKFQGTSRQSFKLDYIANFELGVGKLDYYEMGYESMREFMEKNFSTFIQYNIIDTLLIRLLDEKLKLINLMRRLSNISLCEFENIYQSIPNILGSLTIQARKLGVKYMTNSNKSEDKKDVSDTFEGAFVYPTKPGYYKNGIVSLDFNSLYPNVIMTLNLSPDTKVGKILETEPLNREHITIKKVNGQTTELTHEQFIKLLEEKCTLAPNNVLYLKPAVKFGIVPTFLDALYKDRVAAKKEMKKCIKTLEKIDAAIEQIEKDLKNF